MCQGVYYSHGDRETRVRFADARAMLPVRTRADGVTLLPWGRRPSQAGSLPLGGWARLDSIYAGRWDRWFPQPVKLPVAAFMETDIEGRERWYTLTKGQWLQGLIARDRQERRLYVVTVEPELEDALHQRWPRLMCG